MSPLSSHSRVLLSFVLGAFFLATPAFAEGDDTAVSIPEVPMSLAQELLGADPQVAPNPTSLGEVASAVLAHYDPAAGTIKPGLGLDITARQLGLGGSSVPENAWYRPLLGSSLSIATATLPAAPVAAGAAAGPGGVGLAVGLKLVVADGKDPHAAVVTKTAAEEVRSARAKEQAFDAAACQSREYKSQLSSFDAFVVNRDPAHGSNQPDASTQATLWAASVASCERQRQTTVDKTRVAERGYVRAFRQATGSAWNRGSTIVGAAYELRFLEGRLNAFSGPGRFGAWITGANALGDHVQFVYGGHLRRDVDVNPGWVLALGARLRAGNEAFHAFVEGSYAHTDTLSSIENRRLLPVAGGAEIRVADSLWVNLRLGGTIDLDHWHESAPLLLSSVTWGRSEAAILPVDGGRARAD